MQYPLIGHDAEQSPTIRLYVPQRGVEWRCLQELVYVEGHHNYSWLHWTDAPKLLVPYTIKRFAEKLPITCFGRIHRKFMINYHFVTAWDLRVKASSAVLSTGVNLPISRRYRAVIKQTTAENKGLLVVS